MDDDHAFAKAPLRTLVAGGAGFIGSHLCEALIGAGHKVVCLDNLMSGSLDNVRRLERRSGFSFIHADVIEPLPDAVVRSRFDRIYNLACVASPPAYQIDPEHTLLTSVVGTHQLLRLSESSGARFLLTSTSEVYGDSEVHPQVEDYRGNVSCTGPRACYDEGKRAAETLAFDYARAGRADTRVARIFNTYGPHMHPQDGRVVSNMLCQALSGRPITIYGDGTQTRSFCFVSDMVRGLRALMECAAPPDGPVNLGNPIEQTINTLVQLVLGATGTRLPVVRCPLPQDEPRRRRPDIGKARALLGWSPEVNIEDGILRTAAWLAGQLPAGGDVGDEADGRVRAAAG